MIKKFSIVIPNYNNGEWLVKCITSVLNQTHKDWEMYIIDDMSTDNSIDIINRTIKGKENITLIQNEIKLYNGGSRNVGILKAKKVIQMDIFLFIDSDDWLANNRVLEELNEFIIKNKCPDLITLGYEARNETKLLNTSYSKFTSKFDLFKADIICCAVWAKCFKVSNAPLFEYNTLMEDRNYHYRLIYKCETFMQYGKITHIWNKSNKNSITTNKRQLYESELQCPINWDNCAYRHIAGMLDILNEIKKEDKEYIDYIKLKIEECKKRIAKGIFQQY